MRPATAEVIRPGAARPGSAAARAHAVRAHAVLRVEADPSGRVAQVVELRSAVPLVLRQTGTAPAAAADRPAAAAEAVAGGRALADLVPPPLPSVTVHLVGAAAGPLAGDQLRLDIQAGTGARLVLRSVAATLAMPGHGPGPSVVEINAEVAAGGALDLLPEPTVAVAGCRHRMVGRASVAPGGWLRWREEVLLGRFGEPAGHVDTDLRVDVRAPGGPARPLLRQELALGPDVAGLAGAALLGGARAVGSLLTAAPAGPDGAGPAGLGMAAAASPAHPGDPGGVAVLPLAGPGVLVSAVALDAVTLRRQLGPAAEA